MACILTRVMFDAIDTAMQLYMPEFARVEVNGLPQGIIAYEYQVNHEVKAFILYLRVPNRNRVHVDTAWSCKQQYPSHLTPMAVCANPECGISIDSPVDGEFYFECEIYGGAARMTRGV